MSINTTASGSDFLTRLNALGAKGWEVIESSSGGPMTGRSTILKRRIPSAYELKMIADAEEMNLKIQGELEALKRTLEGNDGEPTH